MAPKPFFGVFYMSQIGSDTQPVVMHTGTVVSKESRYRKGFNKKQYDENYDRIFRKNKLKSDDKEAERASIEHLSL